MVAELSNIHRLHHKLANSFQAITAHTYLAELKRGHLKDAQCALLQARVAASDAQDLLRELDQQCQALEQVTDN